MILKALIEVPFLSDQVNLPMKLGKITYKNLTSYPTRRFYRVIIFLLLRIKNNRKIIKVTQNDFYAD